MSPKTLLVHFDSVSTDQTLAVDITTSEAVSIRRGEPAKLRIAFYEDGELRTDFTGVISVVCDIFKQGSTELLARATTGTIETINTGTEETPIAVGTQYHVQLEFAGAETGNCNPGTIGHDTFQFVAYAITANGNISLGSGLFVVYGLVTLTNPAFPVGVYDQIYMNSSDGTVKKLTVTSDDVGDQILIEKV